MKAGADKDLQSSSGETALFGASDKGHVACVRLLVEAKAGQSPKFGVTLLGGVPLLLYNIYIYIYIYIYK